MKRPGLYLLLLLIIALIVALAYDHAIILEKLNDVSAICGARK